MLPKVILYNVASLDGRIEWAKDSPDAIFSFYELSFQWRVDAILMGSNTVMALGSHEREEDAVEMPEPDKEPLPPGTEQLVYEPRPLLVVPDSGGRIHNWPILQKEPWWRDIIILCSDTTPLTYLDYLDKRHMKWILCGKEKVDLRAALEELNVRFGVGSVRADCGGKLNGILLREGLVHEVNLLVYPILVGGKAGTTIFNENLLNDAECHIELELRAVEKVKGDSVLLRYMIK